MIPLALLATLENLGFRAHQTAAAAGASPEEVAAAAAAAGARATQPAWDEPLVRVPTTGWRVLDFCWCSSLVWYTADSLAS